MAASYILLHIKKEYKKRLLLHKYIDVYNRYTYAIKVLSPQVCRPAVSSGMTNGTTSILIKMWTTP